MSTSPDDAEAAENALYVYLRSLSIAFTAHIHEPVFTVEEARRLRGALPGTHCKCLFLKDKKDQLYLAILREELDVDLKWLSSEIRAARFSFGKPELMWDVLRVRPGAVTPFALMNDSELRVTPVLDAALLSADLVNFHPLRNDRTTAVSPQGLVRFIESDGHRITQVRFAS